MKKTYLAILVAASFLSACGDGGGPPKFGAQISFGDSLSDVGTYAVGTVKALSGGKYTINGDSTAINPELTGQNWTEVMAARFRLPAPCAAQTGLDGDAAQGFQVPVVNHAGCFGYAQGGARVTNPVGPGSKLTGSALGALTVPVARQIDNHLAISGGKFKADDIVFVMAGGNDLLFQIAALRQGAAAMGSQTNTASFESSLVTSLAAGAMDPATAQAAIRAAIVAERASPGSTSNTLIAAAVGAAAVQPGNAAVGSQAVYGPMVAKANSDGSVAGAAAGVAYINANSPVIVAAMAAAGAQLGVLVKDRILTNGARYVTVNNLPDVASTPAGQSQTAQIQALMTDMADAFNAELAKALKDQADVLLVDVHALSQAAAANPVAYGITQINETACDLTAAKNALGSALICNASNLKAGDVSHYAYADEVHPTPFFYRLFARHVMDKMERRGWL